MVRSSYSYSPTALTCHPLSSYSVAPTSYKNTTLIGEATVWPPARPRATMPSRCVELGFLQLPPPPHAASASTPATTVRRDLHLSPLLRLLSPSPSRSRLRLRLLSLLLLFLTPTSSHCVRRAPAPHSTRQTTMDSKAVSQNRAKPMWMQPDLRAGCYVDTKS